MDTEAIREAGHLGPLGVDEVAESTYRVLVDDPSAGADSVALRLGLDTGAVEDALRRLHELGLLRPDERSRIGFAPIAPRAALAGLVHRRQAELELARARLEELAEAFDRRRSSGPTPAVVDVVSGTAELLRRVEELGDAAAEEILVFDTPPYASDLSTPDIAREAGQLDRGVRIRSLYSQESLQIPGRIDRVSRLIALGERARVLPTLPLKLHVYDRAVAVVPLAGTESADERVAIVRRSGLLDGLVALFEALWDRGHPLGGAQDTQLRDGDLSLLTLMAAGLKDDAIARQLGINVRTTRRHIADLTERLEATSRFQAGVEARRRGWVR